MALVARRGERVNVVRSHVAEMTPCCRVTLPIRRGKRLAFHRFQRDLLGEQDIADDKPALWREAPLGDGFGPVRNVVGI
jgi:hypothetical protein